MPLTITCGQCGQSYSVAPHLYGRRVRCTKCQGVLDIPLAPNAMPARSASLPPASQRVQYGAHSGTPASSPSGSPTRLIVLCSSIVAGVLLVLFCAIFLSRLFQSEPSSFHEDNNDSLAQSATIHDGQHQPKDIELIEDVQSDVREIVVALSEGDIETAIRYTHPELKQRMGGEARMRAALKSMMTQIYEAGMEIEEVTFPEPPTFVASDEHDFVIIPNRTIMRMGDKRIMSNSWQLGIRDKGTTQWFYLDGTNTTIQTIRSFFPDFPANQTLPNKSTEIL